MDCTRILTTRQRQRSYRCDQFLLFSRVKFNTDSEEKHHGNTRQEVSREVWRQER